MATHGIVLSATVGPAPTMVLGTDAHRRAILFSPPVGTIESITVSTERDVTAGAGLVLAVGSTAITVTREHFGDAVTRPWFAVSSTGDLSLGLLVAVDGDADGRP